MHHKSCTISAVYVLKHKADIPGKILNAESMFCVCVSTAHLHFELGVEQQHKVDVGIATVHIHQEGVFHHQPAVWPAETKSVMANAVQTLDPVTAWPLDNGSLPEANPHRQHNEPLHAFSILHSYFYPHTHLDRVFSLQALGSQISDEGERTDREKFQLRKTKKTESQFNQAVRQQHV